MSNALIATAVVGVVGLFVGLGVVSYKAGTTIETKTITVVNKERLTEISSDPNNTGSLQTNIKNFVYSDVETYVVEDSVWNWHFTSSTVYAKIQPGTCQVTLSGWRIGWASMFQNIIAADCYK